MFDTTVDPRLDTIGQARIETLHRRDVDRIHHRVGLQPGWIARAQSGIKLGFDRLRVFLRRHGCREQDQQDNSAEHAI